MNRNGYDRPGIPEEEYSKPMNKGGDLPPLPLLPDREWLNAKIVNVDYRYASFNGQIQYVTRTQLDSDTDQEIEVPLLDNDGNKIARKEFNIKFALSDYSLPNDKGPRCCWVTMGASLGEKAHLPIFLYNVLGADFDPVNPRTIIEALEGAKVKLQLRNKPNRKDPTKPPYQQVIYDAVTAKTKPSTPPEPMLEEGPFIDINEPGEPTLEDEF